MDTIGKTPVIDKTDYVIVGGGVAEVAAALYLSERKKKVLLLVRETYLLTGICANGCYNLPKSLKLGALQQRYYNAIFSPETRTGEEGTLGWHVLHPDRLKRHAEELLTQAGARFLYGAVCVGEIPSGGKAYVQIGGKFGVAAIECRSVLRMSYDAFVDRYRIQVMNAPVIEEEVRFQIDEKRYGSFPAILFPGAYENGHAILEVWGTQHPEEDDGRNNLRCRLKALHALRWIKKNYPGYEKMVPARFANCGYSREFSPQKYICAGLDMAKESLQGSQDKKKRPAALPSSWQIQAENSDYSFFPRPYVETDGVEVHEQMRGDVVVVGAGTAGALAAIHAARRGCRVILVEMNNQCGGTGTVGGVNAYGFGRRFAETKEIDGQMKQYYAWLGMTGEKGVWGEFDTFHGGLKDTVLTCLCQKENVKVIHKSLAFAVLLDKREPNRVRGVLVQKKDANIALLGKYVVDATGDGNIAAFAGADSTYGSERDAITYWASLAQYDSPVSYRHNFSSTVMVGNVEDYTRFIVSSRRRGGNVFDHGIYVAPRESRHIHGVTQVTLWDVATFRNYEDTVYTCFSNYAPQGKLSADMIYAGVLPPQNAIAVPLGALLPVKKTGERIMGLLVAGKAVSCTHNALPGMRMQTDLQHQGAVIGILLSEAIKRKTEVADLNILGVQQRIREETGDPLVVGNGGCNPDTDLRRAVEEMDRTERFHWIDFPFEKEVTAIPRSVLLMTAPDDLVVPLLEARFAKETNWFVKDILAGLLLFHGSETGTEYHIKMLEDKLAQGGLEQRKGSVACVQLLPDHGVMAELVYQLQWLAWSKNEEICPLFESVLLLLLKEERDYFDIRKSIYHYIECFAYVAERTGFAPFIPMLKTLGCLPELQKSLTEFHEKSDVLAERQVILLLSVYRALARCGDRIGYEKLADFTGLPCSSIAQSACMELRSLTGKVFPAQAACWKSYLASKEFILQKRLITKKVW